MDIAVPSRFACLKIEDDDNRPQVSKPKEAKKKIEKKVLKKIEKEVKLEKTIVSKKSSNSKQNANSALPNKKDKKRNAQQWEEWKQKDHELVNGNFEEDLQNAILLSKLDYENKKESYKPTEEPSEKEKAPNKKKKSKAMSLDQFLNSDNKNASAKSLPANSKSESVDKDDNFFDQIQVETKQELNKEQLREKRKKRETNIDEIISIAQCQEKLEQERAKNFALQLELEKAKTEIAAVKERNMTLCGILGHGEMKDKADVLLELERLNSVKNELTEEVSRLHALLEQERSKVAALSSDSHNNKHKDKKRKQKGA